MAFRMHKIRFNLSAPLCALALFAASCSNIDCPLDNIVLMTAGLYDAETGKTLTLSDTLTVSATGSGIRDTVLLNRATAVSSFAIPLRHAADCDTLLLRFANASGQSATDTLRLSHTNTLHFESIDCPTAVFFTLNEATWTSHSLGTMPLTIDSVAFARKSVNYDDVENIKIYLRSTSVR